MTDDYRVIVTQYCTSTTWFIRLEPDRLIPRRKDVPDWSQCPGTLYQDYETSEQAAEVARWWGFEPVIEPHVHGNHTKMYNSSTYGKTS